MIPVVKPHWPHNGALAQNVGKNLKTHVKTNAVCWFSLSDNPTIGELHVRFLCMTLYRMLSHFGIPRDVQDTMERYQTFTSDIGLL